MFTLSRFEHEIMNNITINKFTCPYLLQTGIGYIFQVQEVADDEMFKLYYLERTACLIGTKERQFKC